MKKHPEFEIAGRKVGYEYEPLVIAELGINHGGSLNEAKKIVDAASEIGVEIIKHQTHIPSDEMSSEAKSVVPGHTKESIFEIKVNKILCKQKMLQVIYISHFFSAGFLKSNSIGFNGCVPSALAYFRLQMKLNDFRFPVNGAFLRFSPTSVS